MVFKAGSFCASCTLIISMVTVLPSIFPQVAGEGGKNKNDQGRGGSLPDILLSQPGPPLPGGGASDRGRNHRDSSTIDLSNPEHYFPQHVDHKISCDMRNSCQAPGRDLLTYRDMNCFCDPLCQTFGDCCQDYQPSSSAVPASSVKIQNKMIHCERLLDYNREVEVYIVDSCPKKYRDPEVIRQCEYTPDAHSDFFYKLPVSGLVSGILYKNYYCALCSGDSNVSFWSVEISCDHPPEGNITSNPISYMARIVQESSDDWYRCHKKIHTSIEVRKCKSAISRCMKGANKRLKKKCKKETSYVYAGKEVFKNKYCAECYGMNDTYLSCEDTRIPQRGPDEGSNFGVQRYSPFSLNLDFNTGKGVIQDHRDGVVSGERRIAIPFSDIEECEANSMYDPFARRCRLLMCPPDSKPQGGECVIASSTNPAEPTKKDKDRPVVESGGSIERIETPGGASIDLDLSGVAQPPVDLDKLPNRFDNEPGLDNHPTSLKCDKMNTLKYMYTDYEMYNNGSVYVFSLGKMFGISDYEFQAPYLYICQYPDSDRNGGVRKPPRNPPRNKNKDQNSHLHPFNSEDQNKDQYDEEDTEATHTVIMMFQFDRLQSLVSFVTVLVSLVAMLIMFIVYLMLPPLRNVPGKNIMCLVFSLFVAQILFLVAMPRTEWYELCLGLAAAMHYFWLAAFFWMNVLAFDIWRTFVSRVNKTSERAKTCRFVGYSIYAWFMPALVVAAALILDLKVFDGVDDIYLPKYGHGICWIVHRYALLFLFALPLAVLLLTNLIFYFATLVNICRISRMSEVQNRGKDRCRLCIYIKLSLVMGLTWVFGFLAELLNMKIFWYLFIGFNAFQGVFICMAFVLNKKVFKLLSKGRNGTNRRQQNSDFRACSNGVRGGPGSTATNRSYFSDGSANKVIAQETSI